MIAIQENVPLAPLTTIGLGGPARYFLRAVDEEEIREGLQFARERKLALFVLGGGSNVVFDDAGFPGLVLQIALRGTQRQEKAHTVHLSVRAGESWDSLVESCVIGGLAGVECLSGIPGQVGSVPVQNVGAYGQEVSTVIQKVDVLDSRTGESMSFRNADCLFDYRSSFFKTTEGQRYIITCVHFALEAGGTPRINYPELKSRLKGDPGLAEVRSTVLALRAAKGMLAEPPCPRSCGSFFLNPILSPAETRTLQEQLPGLPVYPATEGRFKISAAFLIEACGISRGFRQAGSTAAVSPWHSLSLISEGNSARELIALAHFIQNAVQEKTGVRLEMEPIVYPTDRLSR
ncbi:MAG: UDP-N-acetylmuramate dehydrogenase [Spirochaetales bacterium]|nr:UDP-N-acetylmuramate dehydrogenase [Spirochaetales bacterium]